MLILTPAEVAWRLVSALPEDGLEPFWRDPAAVEEIPAAEVIVVDADAPGAERLLARIRRERPTAALLVLSGGSFGARPWPGARPAPSQSP